MGRLREREREREREGLFLHYEFSPLSEIGKEPLLRKTTPSKRVLLSIVNWSILEVTICSPREQILSFSKRPIYRRELVYRQAQRKSLKLSSISQMAENLLVYPFFLSKGRVTLTGPLLAKMCLQACAKYTHSKLSHACASLTRTVCLHYILSTQCTFFLLADSECPE